MHAWSRLIWNLKTLDSLSPVTQKWGSMVMLWFRFSEGNKSSWEEYLKRLSICHLPPTERNQGGRGKVLLWNSREGKLGPNMHSWTSCAISPIYRSQNWAPYPLELHKKFFHSDNSGFIHLWKALYSLPRFICNLTINFWIKLVLIYTLLISQHLKMGNFLYIYQFI